ncbi:hypothetical protein [Pontibacter burrus]|uniref:Uncharacterized protein n=1 Tax=Pontibacter burrus TaxID=2704466 RepID=A0A6B3LRN1_9BACT|nr:hypothetical protein [Pontibacter burrus]NEM96154.1 hypothetical protein [Pontibacter burrus]
MECAPLTGATNLTPDCSGLYKRGGADKTFYLLAISQIAGYTIDPTTKELSGITLKPGEKAIKFSGRKLKNSVKAGIAQGENGPTYPHGGKFAAYYSTQLEKETIETVAKAQDLVLIAPLNSGHFEAHGLLDTFGLADGLSLSAPEIESVQYDDTTALMLDFAGSSGKMPIYCKFGEDRAANFAYLEALLTPAA